MKFKAEGLIIARVSFLFALIRELWFSIRRHWLVLHPKQSARELVNPASEKTAAVKLSLHVGSETICGPGDGAAV